jgi:hypothetical protein
MSKLSEVEQDSSATQSEDAANAAYQNKLIAAIFNSESDSQNDAVNNPGLDATVASTAEVLKIYKNNFIENGIRALAITFPTVEGLISEDSFRVLARHYLLQEHKAEFDWAEYGESMADYIDEQEALESSPFLGECAELDWCIHQIQRAANKTFASDSFSKLESENISQLRFVAAPGLQLLLTWFPVCELHQLVHDPMLQTPEGAKQRSELTASIQQKMSAGTIHSEDSFSSDAINIKAPRSLVLWRAEYKTEFEYLSDAEAAIIEKILQGNSVAHIIEALSERGLDITAWLTDAIQKQRIFAVE